MSSIRLPRAACSGSVAPNSLPRDAVPRLNAEVAKVLVGDWGYGQANAKGMAGVDPEVLKGKGYVPVYRLRGPRILARPRPGRNA